MKERERGTERERERRGRWLIGREARRSRVARSKNIKKAKFGHKQFQKRPNPEKWKKGQIKAKFPSKI